MPPLQDCPSLGGKNPNKQKHNQKPRSQAFVTVIIQTFSKPLKLTKFRISCQNLGRDVLRKEENIHGLLGCAATYLCQV